MRRALAVFALLALTACGVLLSAESDPVDMQGTDAAGGEGGNPNGDGATGDGATGDGSSMQDGSVPADCGTAQNDPLNCGACGRRCNLDAGCTGTTCDRMVVFATSRLYTGGGFGGTQGDLECDALAQAAGLGGHFRVWVQVSVPRFTLNGIAHHNTNGDRLSGKWPPGPALEHAVAFDEMGAAVAAPVDVWSNLAGDGTLIVGDNCAGWGSSSVTVKGAVGSAVDVSSTWTRADAGVPCSEQHRLYCIEMP